MHVLHQLNASCMRRRYLLLLSDSRVSHAQDVTSVDAVKATGNEHKLEPFAYLAIANRQGVVPGSTSLANFFVGQAPFELGSGAQGKYTNCLNMNHSHSSVPAPPHRVVACRLFGRDIGVPKPVAIADA